MAKKGTHRGSVKDDGGAETSRRATAPRRQHPHRKRRLQSFLLALRRGRRQSPSAATLLLSKKGKHVRRVAAGLPRAERVSNASRCSNRLGSIVLTLDELRQITNNFSDDQILGEGALGKVYKGVLKNGDMIAVKRFPSTIAGLQDVVQYENEAKHLMRLKHPNIVQLVGYCSETEMKLVRHNGTFVRAEETERLLCLEYMAKGSLRDHLSDESPGLDWDMRYKIIEGICRGLHYLHEEQVTPIIHRDLKPGNILLDDNMVPKIADFGLSRLFGEDQTRTCTISFKGTPGYMPPEYLEKGVITKKFDIFSLGVIIIEIVTGLKDYPIDETETTSQQYIDLVLNNWRKRLGKAQGSRSHDTDYQQIKTCIQIGLLCVFDLAKRPTINQIVKLLERLDNEAYKNERKIREEAAKALASFLSRAPSLSRTLVDQNQPPRYKLSFMNGLDTRFIVTKKVICDIDREPLTIRVISNDPDGIDAHILSAKIKVVVLDGDFNRHNQEFWTPEEFSNSIVCPGDQIGAILTGDLELSLVNGEAYLRGATFIDNSTFLMSRRFRLGVMVADDLSERVQEGITEPFIVRDRRYISHRKPDLPLLNNHVWRLYEIDKGGAFHRALRHSGIMLVKDFLRLYYKDEQALRKILSGATEVVWTTIVEHAKKCDPGRDLYSYSLDEGNSVILFFNSVYQIVGVKFVDHYLTFDDLEKTTKDLVVQRSRVAYEKMSFNQPDYEMGDDGIPRPKDNGMFQV